MRKRAVIGMVVVFLFLVALSRAVVAQQGPGNGPGPMMREGTKEMTPEQFSDAKARVLKMIDERKARLDKEKTCVEAATNGAELNKCRPERPGGMKGGGMQGDPGRQRAPRQGNEQRQ